MEPTPKEQVFISHVHEERHVAAVLQKYISRAFSGLDVFAAFDKESIGGGQKWFTYITDSLKRSKAVVVLVSHASHHRPWLNFEAGLGDGTGARVVPVSIRDFSLGKLKFPLLGYQGRSIDDLPGILADIADRTGLSSNSQVLADYLSELREAEATMAYKTINTKPFLMDNELQFRIKNAGNSDIELLMLEASVPRKYLYPATGDPRDVLRRFTHCELEVRDGEQYVWFACTSQRGVFGEKPAGLRPILTVTMGPIIAKELNIRLTRPHSIEDNLPVYYHVHAIDHPIERERVMLVDLLSNE